MTDEIVEEQTTEEESPVYSGKYCDSDDVLALCEEISANPSENLLKVVIDNAKSWIETNLKQHYVHIPTTAPDTLKTVAIYYAASDILMSLYHGEEYESLMDYWFNKAQGLLDGYIESYLNNDAEESELANHRRVKSKHGKTYNQKRGRRSIRRWVR